MEKLRVRSPLNEDEESLMRTAIACAIEAHRELGPGLLENFYHRALCMELEAFVTS
jgi:GxxExxY protein